MKIVCTYQNNISTHGFAATLEAVYGNDFKLWMMNSKPIFDVFDEINPDIFIIHAQLINDFVKDVLKEYNQTKVIVITDQMNEFATINPREDLANISQFSNGEIKDCFRTDVIYWSRNENVSSELLQALDLIYIKHSLKIFGIVRIDMPQYLGVLNSQDTAHALASATINLDFNNNSRFDAAVNNTLSVCYNPDHTSQINNDFPSVHTFEQIQKDITILLSEELLYKKELKRIRKLVKEKYTFHHELANTFTNADLTDEAEKILEDLEKRW